MSNLENLYREFERLGGDADGLRELNPTEAQISDLVAGMKRLLEARR